MMDLLRTVADNLRFPAVPDQGPEYEFFRSRGVIMDGLVADRQCSRLRREKSILAPSLYRQQR